jgi:hypothetical protein
MQVHEMTKSLQFLASEIVTGIDPKHGSIFSDLSIFITDSGCTGCTDNDLRL